jgi:uncharacterized protein (TIGR02145 family)
VVDIDGNVYTEIRIGTQIWTVENLRVTKYCNGDVIPEVTVNATWAGLTTGARCWYNNTADAAWRLKYGLIYNGFVLTDPRGVCSVDDGWRIATDADYTTLRDHLIANGFNWDGTLADDKTGKSLASKAGEWDASATDGNVGNAQATNNTSGFTALPGGVRLDTTGAFSSAGSFCRFRTSAVSGAVYSLTSGGSNFGRTLSNLKYGGSVRLVKDYKKRAGGGPLDGSFRGGSYRGGAFRGGAFR